MASVIETKDVEQMKNAPVEEDPEKMAKCVSLKTADTVLAIDDTYTPEEERQLVRKLDMVLMPFVCVFLLFSPLVHMPPVFAASEPPC